MKNKETIIDSIDVSKCRAYMPELDRDNCIALAHNGGSECEKTHDCYFKQLARAKEEIKKLKVQIENEKQALQIDIDNLNQACLDLNQENDDLQNKLQAKEHELIMAKADLCKGCKYKNEKLKSQLNNNQQEDDRGYCETYDCKYYNNLEECQKQNCWYKNYSKEHTKNVLLKKQLQAKEQEIEILKTQNIALQTMEFEEKKKYKKALKRIEHLVTHAFCLTIGTNKDTANLAQQIMRIVAKAKDGE